MSSTICISLSISTEQQFFIKMIKSNQLKITTRDAGASGLHSNAAHWNEELFVLFNKKLPYCHFVKFYCLKPDKKTYFESQFLKPMALMRSVGMQSRRSSVTSDDFQLIDFHHVDRKLFSYRNGKTATKIVKSIK